MKKTIKNNVTFYEKDINAKVKVIAFRQFKDHPFKILLVTSLFELVIRNNYPRIEKEDIIQEITNDSKSISLVEQIIDEEVKRLKKIGTFLNG